MYPGVRRNGHAARQYANVHSESITDEATPHQLIQMLMSGFIARVNSAKGAMERSDYELKSTYISKAMAIVSGLNEAIDIDKGGDIALNLRDLYEYLTSRLLVASQENDPAILDEVTGLMKDIKSAWDAIA